MSPGIPVPAWSALADNWGLDRGIVFLNHGSYGACPRPVLDYQLELRERMEEEPVRFFHREFSGLLEESRRALGAFTGARADDLAMIPNATAGVNIVLESLDLRPGDELLTTSHDYAACRNALRRKAARTGAQVVVAKVPFPLRDPGQVTETVLNAITPRTRLLMIDHVTSPTAVVFPVAEIIAACRERGVPVLVDGAHAPGMLDLDIESLGCDWYTGNCHKWLCAPKGAAFLWARRDRQAELQPLAVSHGYSVEPPVPSRFRMEFDWTGTADYTAMLAVPRAIAFMGTLLPEGWPGVRARNHQFAVAARRILCDALGAEPGCPGDMLGSMVSIELPPDPPPVPARGLLGLTRLQHALYERHRIEVPVINWPDDSRRWVRVSAQLYNDLPQIEFLAHALREELRREKSA
ncbi:MAG: Isopenicillin N epimerase [Myxococcota bacterium]|nr:Isopenicillin N epimerase [Myxococcota bacterium]